MDIKKIRSLIRLVEDSQVSEVSIQEGEFSIRIRKEDRNAQTSVQTVTIPTAASAPAMAAPAPAAAPSASPAATDAGAGEEITGGYVQKSPIVGTFYTAPSPEATPYVNVGDTVTKGQTLCIIEAMKIMNEIEAEVDGKVEKIVAKNATAVEYDQPLFVIAAS